MKVYFSKKTMQILGASTLLGCLAHTGWASGFSIQEQGVKGLGESYSGAAIESRDASAVYFNPAGMPLLGKTELQLGVQTVIPSFKFDNDGSKYLSGLPLSGGNGGDAGELAPVPNFYYNQVVNETMAVGLGINAPFGLATEYDDGWVGRYTALRSDVSTININPSFGWKINDMISIGFGVDIQYVHAELSQAVDFGALLYQAGVAGATPQGLDGKATIEGEDWSLGGNIGIMVTPVKGTTMGLTYRSNVDHELSGDATFDVPGVAKAFQAKNIFVDTDVTAKLNLPETVSFSVGQRIGDKWMVMGDVSWTHWSRFDELRISYDSNQPDSVTEENWDDTVRFSLGANYQHSEKLVLRVGTAYDPTPIPSDAYRTPRIPDGDRIWLSTGCSYVLNEDWSFDVGYLHLFFNETKLEHISGSYLINGTYTGHADVVSLQVCYTF